MKLSGLTKMVKRQLVCNVFHNDESDDFYIGTASAIYCATGFPRPLNRNQMGAMLGISEDTMIEKVVYNDFDCAYKIDFQGFNLDDTIKDEVEVKKLGIGMVHISFLLSWCVFGFLPDASGVVESGRFSVRPVKVSGGHA